VDLLRSQRCLTPASLTATATALQYTATASNSWETVGGAVGEGPEMLRHNGKTFIVDSASHCSTPDYKLGLLTYNGGDPLLSSLWVKSPNPVFQWSNANGVYGAGHGNFLAGRHRELDGLPRQQLDRRRLRHEPHDPGPRSHLERRRHAQLRRHRPAQRGPAGPSGELAA
jgi:GH43 family beta-xylosidase